MTTSQQQTKAGRKTAIRLTRVLAGVGLTAALASLPAFASDGKGEEASENHGSAKLKGENL